MPGAAAQVERPGVTAGFGRVGGGLSPPHPRGDGFFAGRETKGSGSPRTTTLESRVSKASGRVRSGKVVLLPSA